MMGQTFFQIKKKIVLCTLHVGGIVNVIQSTQVNVIHFKITQQRSN